MYKVFFFLDKNEKSDYLENHEKYNLFSYIHIKKRKRSKSVSSTNWNNNFYNSDINIGTRIKAHLHYSVHFFFTFFKASVYNIYIFFSLVASFL